MDRTRDRALGRRALPLIPLAALAIPLFANEYVQYVVNLILVYVLVGVGFNIVLGNIGQLAFANALSAAFADLVRRYHDDQAPGGRTFRVFAAGYPAVPDDEQPPAREETAR